MQDNSSSTKREAYTFAFHSFRNISAPEDTANARKVYAGKAPVSSFISIPTDQNVREYIAAAEGKIRHTLNNVHKAISNTLREDPDSFSVLNGGITIVASDFELDEAKKVVRLYRPSIINGAQTQGVLKDVFADYSQKGWTFPDAFASFELIVTADENLIAEISIARNSQNNVQPLSIAGASGHLDQLQSAFNARLPERDKNLLLKKSETDLRDDYVATERLLQVITALIPAELWPKQSERDDPNKAYTYAMKARCLKDFQELYKKVNIGPTKISDKKQHIRDMELYQFYLDIAAEAYQLHEKWKSHQGFRGTRLRSIDREGEAVVDVPDGIVFPIIASLSTFAEKGKDGWSIKVPIRMQDDELIRTAKTAYQEIAKSNPNTMGKSKACYSMLSQLTRFARNFS